MDMLEARGGDGPSRGEEDLQVPRPEAVIGTWVYGEAEVQFLREG